MRRVMLAVVALLCLVGVTAVMATAMAQPMQLHVSTEMHEENSDTSVSTSTELEVNETETTLEQEVTHQTGMHGGVMVKEQVREHVKEQNAGAVQQVRVMEKVRERLHPHKVEEDYMKAKHDYKAIREEYHKLKQQGRADFGHAKRYCLAGGMYIENWFDRIENMILTSNMDEETKEAMLAKIEEERAAFEEKLQAINESETPEELREAVKELKEEWKNVRVLVKAVAMQVAIVRIETTIEKAEDLQLKLEGQITELDDAKLAAMLEDYAAKLEEAKEKLNEAKDILVDAETREDVHEAQQLIREAISLLRDAFKDVREIVRTSAELRLQIREQEGKIFFGNQTGELFVVGNGTAKFEGTGIVVVRGSGEITVEPETAIVTLVGFGSKSVEGGVAKVSGEGKAVIRGENIKVTIEGENIKLFVKGYGTATLEGEGIYRVKKLPQYNMTEETYEGSVEVEIGGEQ
ncbi:hypothetical protein [Archaeoglobus veneficus]|uniref:Uncharacterized protein n=1 Tax=Archaeoglobus veneficus (strain DSM 11195 / SNP6) TaxID=693661 RepID=F2KQ05_ARCVS|nr:hypothetical protein [Archaeoglobus veneficus]AEA47608.1 hypothetical protein Arcve_1608 [Archaeoglobus veneficus SNP6]